VADRAGAAGTVDGVAVAAAGDGLLHLRAGGLEDGAELVVAEVGERAPRVDSGGEASLALEDIADAGDQVLVEQGVAEGAAGIGVEGVDDRIEVEVRRQDVGAEASELGVAAETVGGNQPQGRAAELGRLLGLPTSTAQAERRGLRQRAPRG
jgi:hypothetical protein